MKVLYRGEGPVLLIMTDTVDEYSLAEEPHPEDKEWRSDSDRLPRADATQQLP
jgi:hypothetical protein